MPPFLVNKIDFISSKLSVSNIERSSDLPDNQSYRRTFLYHKCMTLTEDVMAHPGRVDN